MCLCGYTRFILWIVFCISLTPGVKQESIRNRILADISNAGRLLLRQGNDTSQEVKQNCVCSKIYDPVCASNNKSYYNVCHMECLNEPNTVFVVHQGNCIPY